MPSAESVSLFRSNVGDPNGTVFSNAEVDLYFAQAAALYGANGDNAQVLYASMLGIRAILVNAAKRVSYKQNNSTENMSDVFKHLKQLYEVYKLELEDAVNLTLPVVRWGNMKPLPTRVKAYPGDYDVS